MRGIHSFLAASHCPSVLLLVEQCCCRDLLTDRGSLAIDRLIDSSEPDFGRGLGGGGVQDRLHDGGRLPSVDEAKGHCIFCSFDFKLDPIGRRRRMGPSGGGGVLCTSSCPSIDRRRDAFGPDQRSGDNFRRGE
jgi:hypothetical protein